MKSHPLDPGRAFRNGFGDEANKGLVVRLHNHGLAVNVLLKTRQAEQDRQQLLFDLEVTSLSWGERC